MPNLQLNFLLLNLYPSLHVLSPTDNENTVYSFGVAVSTQLLTVMFHLNFTVTFHLRFVFFGVKVPVASNFSLKFMFMRYLAVEIFWGLKFISGSWLVYHFLSNRLISLPLSECAVKMAKVILQLSEGPIPSILPVSRILMLRMY